MRSTFLLVGNCSVRLLPTIETRQFMDDDQNQTEQPQTDDFESLKRIIDCLRPLDKEGKVRLLKSAITFLRLDSAFGLINTSVSSSAGPASAAPGGSQRESLGHQQSGFSERKE